MTKGTPQFAQLDQFVNATTARREALLYNPHRVYGKSEPKHLDVMLGTGSDEENLRRGLSLTEKWTREMITYDWLIFPGKRTNNATWTEPILIKKKISARSAAFKKDMGHEF